MATGYGLRRPSHDTEPTPAARRRWLPFAIGGAVVLLGGAVWGGVVLFSAPDAPETFSLSGTVTLPQRGVSTFTVAGERHCEGTEGFGDVAGNAPVTVYDQAGTIVGVGKLYAGEIDPSSSVCRMRFAVDGVSASATAFQVEVSHRGRVTVSSDDARNGRAAFSLEE